MVDGTRIAKSRATSTDRARVHLFHIACVDSNTIRSSSRTNRISLFLTISSNVMSKTTIDRIVHRGNPWRRRAGTLWIKDVDHGLFLCRPFRRFYGATDVGRRRLVRRAVPVEADSERERITYDAFTKDRSLKRRPSEVDSTAVHPAVSFRLHHLV